MLLLPFLQTSFASLLFPPTTHSWAAKHVHTCRVVDCTIATTDRRPRVRIPRRGIALNLTNKPLFIPEQPTPRLMKLATFPFPHEHHLQFTARTKKHTHTHTGKGTGGEWGSRQLFRQISLAPHRAHTFSCTHKFLHRIHRPALIDGNDNAIEGRKLSRRNLLLLLVLVHSFFLVLLLSSSASVPVVVEGLGV